MSIQIKKASLLAASLLALGQGTASAGNIPTPPSLVPSNPAAGECYARVKVPARMESRAEQVMVQEGFTEYQVSQPHISTRQQQVMTKDASVEYRVRQPRYSTVTEQMMVRPAYEKLEVSYAKFKTVTETRQVTAPRLIWKKGNPGQLAAQGYVIHSTADGGPAGMGYGSTVQYGATRSADTHCGDTCEIWCLVEEPGQTVSYNRRVLEHPGMVNRVPVPAEYQSITKQVLVDPGGVEEIPVPAQYSSVTVQDVQPARATQTHIPPKYDQVVSNVPVENERWEWRRVVCEPGTKPMQTPPAQIVEPAQITTYPAPTYTAPTYTAPTYSAPTYSAPQAYTGHSTMNYEGVCREGDTRHECVTGAVSAYEGVSSGHHYGGSTGSNSTYSHSPSGYTSRHTTSHHQSHSGGTATYPSYSGSSGYQTHGGTGYQHGGGYTQSSGTVYDKATGYYEKASSAHDAYETVKRTKKRWRR